MNKIENKIFDEERALYNLKNTNVSKCIFSGKEDGESALKETRNILVGECRFSLRYPLWHASHFSIDKSIFDDTARAPLWYSKDGYIKSTKILAPKAVRECDNINILNSEISSAEFGWKTRNITVENTILASEYLFFGSEYVTLKNVNFKGKYSFQYVKNLVIRDSILDTKDAFWHSENVLVVNSVIKGEYLGWFSKNVKLVNCKIEGTQPLCYATHLVIENSTMTNTDFAFEYSTVKANIIGHIDSVKNIKDGVVICDSVGEIINEDAVYPTKGKVKLRK